jgi:uncharacterized membrane protein
VKISRVGEKDVDIVLIFLKYIYIYNKSYDVELLLTDHAIFNLFNY